MLNIYQQTLESPVSFDGKGLHSGEKVRLKIIPGSSNQGIIFKRVDLKENNLIKANINHVSSTKLCTTLKNRSGVKVSTVEHLLAALYISEIDNAIIEINREEVPIMDGSAKNFVDALKSVRLKKLKSKRKYLKISKKIDFVDANKKISIEPNNSSFEVAFQLNYENPIIGQQKNQINLQNDNLLDVIESRTFCLFDDINEIKKMGLAKGGSLDNAIVVDKDKVLNKNGLRNNKEFVNHKILDLVGDFVLSGYRILGKVSCFEGGHYLSSSFLRTILKNNSCFDIIELADTIITKKLQTNQPVKMAVSA